MISCCQNDLIGSELCHLVLNGRLVLTGVIWRNIVKLLKFWLGVLFHYGSIIKHRWWVHLYIVRFICFYNEPRVIPVEPSWKLKLYVLALAHDMSKFRWSETKYFAKVIFKLKHATYGSELYRALLRSIVPAIDLHYMRNLHHPEHYMYHECNGCFSRYHKEVNVCSCCGYSQFQIRGGGFRDMSYIRRVEMMADWMAATRRHNDGDIEKSFVVNKERFHMTDLDVERLKCIVFWMK